MTGTIDTEATAASAGGRPTAGAKLRAAREAAGLSVDAVAQQLKLAPRQVKALEDDDWQRLPGRTFVRGFARNYARFVRLDPDAVLALLPALEGVAHTQVELSAVVDVGPIELRKVEEREELCVPGESGIRP